MANSKIQLASGEVLIDLTADTVNADNLLQGITAHDKAGNPIIGTYAGGTTVQEYSGTFTPDNSGSATVNIGFKPDIVTIVAPSSIQDPSGKASISFTADYSVMRTGDEFAYSLGYPDSAGFMYYFMASSPTANGFIVELIGYTTTSWQTVPLTGFPLTFKAVKFS